jgi:hypothetical protein
MKLFIVFHQKLKPAYRTLGNLLCTGLYYTDQRCLVSGPCKQVWRTTY